MFPLLLSSFVSSSRVISYSSLPFYELFLPHLFSLPPFPHKLLTPSLGYATFTPIQEFHIWLFQSQSWIIYKRTLTQKIHSEQSWANICLSLCKYKRRLNPNQRNAMVSYSQKVMVLSKSQAGALNHTTRIWVRYWLTIYVCHWARVAPSLILN